MKQNILPITFYQTIMSTSTKNQHSDVVKDSENKAISTQLILNQIQLPQDILNCVYSFTFQDKEIYATKKNFSKMLTQTFKNVIREGEREGLYPGHWAFYYNRTLTEEEMNGVYYIFTKDDRLQLQGVSCMSCGNYIFHNMYELLQNHDNKYLYCLCQDEQNVRSEYIYG